MLVPVAPRGQYWGAGGGVRSDELLEGVMAETAKAKREMTFLTQAIDQFSHRRRCEKRRWFGHRRTAWNDQEMWLSFRM